MEGETGIMFAKYWTQDKEIKKIFYQKIEEKIKNDKKKMMDKIDENLPRILAVLTKPVANFQFENQRMHREMQGSNGENTISNTLWFWLPRNYRFFDDVVLEPEKDEFIQLDHLVIAPQGIFIIEAKTWNGVIFATEKTWRLKVGNKKWVKIENPVKQNERHTKLFKKWLNDNLPEKKFLQEIVYPVVVLKKTAWFKAKETVEMPIVMGGLELVSFIKSFKANKIDDMLSKTICEKIQFAKPYEEKIKFTEGTTRYGKKYVRVNGTFNNALKVCETYKEKGYKTTGVKKDKKDENVFYFYIEK